MRGIFALAFLLLPSVAMAQAIPHKLVVMDRSGGLAITDYPSRQRCERARGEIEAIANEQNSKAPTQVPGGGVIIPQRIYLRVFCISG